MSKHLAKQIQILTLFPEAIEPYLESSLLGKAAEKGVLKINCIQIRDYATDRHRSVDDSPYGGGDGMVMRADVLYAAWMAARSACEDSNPYTIYLSPQGRTLSAQRARELAAFPQSLILVCGHYEGIDERFIEKCVDEEISIGDYVLSGGELAALVVVDAVARFVPGVIGQMANVDQDSFEGGLLKYPQYTRPPVFEGLSVPEVLTSGNHGEIAKWRKSQAQERTKRKRPDLK